MSWVAIDRGVKAVGQFGLEGPVERWRALRDTIRFPQAFSHVSLVNAPGTCRGAVVRLCRGGGVEQEIASVFVSTRLLGQTERGNDGDRAQAGRKAAMSARRTRFPAARPTLRGIMSVVAASALVLAVATQPGAHWSVFLLFLILIPFVAIYLAIYPEVLLPLTRPLRCPSCSKWSLERVAIVSFGPRLFRCSSCGAGYKRAFLGGFWRAVESSQDDAVHESTGQAESPKFEPWSAGDERPGSANIDSLVRNHRQRHR